MDDESVREDDRVEFHDYYKYRVSYITQKNFGLIFLFVTGLTDKFQNIKKELEKCKREFTNLFEEILQHRFDAKTFEVFDPIVDTIHKNLRPKISLVGFSGVGKTTITKLIRAEEIPMQHVPTITGDIATVRIGKLHFHLWDFAGQEQFSYLWNNFVKGSDAVLLITDSTLENVEKSKFFLELIREEASHAHTAVVGNKQDLNGALTPSQIERLLSLKTYSMIAKDPDNRDKMIQIIADILEMSAEVSPLLKPLLERDKLIEEASKALKGAEFEKAAFLFDKISYLCVELGDDSLGKEFFEKSQKIKGMLEQVDAPQPTPAHPIETDRTEKIKKKEDSKENVQFQPPASAPKSEIPNPPSPTLPPTTFTEPTSKKATNVSVSKVKQETSREWIKLSKQKQDMSEGVNTEIKNENLELNLNPDDFMVKLRPKRIGDIPKGTKPKLKTSAFGHVENVKQPVERTEEVNINPKRKITMKDFEEFTQVKSTNPHKEFQNTNIPPTTQTPQIRSEKIGEKQKEEVQKKLIELKLKRADLYKMTLDFDMKELNGEISAKELHEKKAKIKEYEKKIEEQIRELQRLLKD
jgi:small GTP-binding protein